MRAMSERLPRIALAIASMPRPPTTSATTTEPAKVDSSDKATITTAKRVKEMPNSRSTTRFDVDVRSCLDELLLIG